MKIESFQDCYLAELKDMYHAEKQLVRTLPRLVKAASSPELRRAFENHLEETRGHVERLETIFEQLGERAATKRCAGMEGIIEEGKEVLEHDLEEPVTDALLIAGAQKAEHYEMASYGTLRAWAQLLGHQEQARLLQETLDEEKNADRKLNEIAQRQVNTKALLGETVPQD
jgi:ferritin-like metal-binding protein YciE